MRVKYFFLFTLSLLVMSGCEDVLDKRNLNTVDDTIWNDYTASTVYLNSLYSQNMPSISLGVNAGYSDEGFSSSEEVTNIMWGVVDETQVGAISEFNMAAFENIRRINIGIQGINSGSLSAEEKEVLAGQAYFFRAWRNWELVKLYGGIPLVAEAQDPFFDELDVPRSTTKASVDFIVSDLDKAIAGLPERWELSADQGRITCGAAAAFKGRVLLHFASPMFNPENKVERWEAAYTANTEAKNMLDAAGFGLHEDFSQMFIVNPVNNPEAVLFRSYKENSDYSSGWEGSIRPPSGGGNMGSTPTWDLAQAFPMANGKPIDDPESGYDAVRYWENRDPRFYHTIAYNGATWEMAGRDGSIVWTPATFRGEDNRTAATGMLNRKASNSAIDRNNTGNTSTSWLEIRYAEVLLNLAECSIELAKQEEAITLMSQVRQRAGVESADNYGLGASVDMETLMRERQVEFAFENKRYWDLRRRRMFTDDLGENSPKLNGRKRTGLDIRGKGVWSRRIGSGDFRGATRLDTAIILGHVDLDRPGDYETYFEVSVKNLDNLQPSGVDAIIAYPEICYFFGIQTSVLSRSPAVEQTLGWQYGTFDPLKE
ncbi:MAG: RagB/SusD family nutrient uptake outer membrane protein [Bacteroidales bacterium]|nr:RagB/SusD family nutrient uptake outer membrane protein [Bacteroidales bacterium]